MAEIIADSAKTTTKPASSEMSKDEISRATLFLKELESQNPDYRLMAAERLMTLDDSPQEQLKIARFITEANASQLVDPKNYDLPHIEITLIPGGTTRVISGVNLAYETADGLSSQKLDQESNQIALKMMKPGDMKQDLKTRTAEVVAMDKAMTSP